MPEPKKSLHIFMFIGLIALNIGLLAMVLQRALPDPTTQAKMVSPKLQAVFLKKKRHPGRLFCSSLLKARIATDVHTIPTDKIPGYFSKPEIATITDARISQSLRLLDR